MSYTHFVTEERLLPAGIWQAQCDLRKKRKKLAPPKVRMLPGLFLLHCFSGAFPGISDKRGRQQKKSKKKQDRKMREKKKNLPEQN